MNYLDKIWSYKKGELEATMRRRPLSDVKAAARDVEAARSFYGALTSDERAATRIIAEVKKASPSRGVLVEDFDPVAIACDYEVHGAQALSVLTDRHFFQGELGTIASIKKRVGLPVLRKDFTLHEYHLYEARAAGADAVLLIARMLETIQLQEYEEMIREMGMTTLLEVHDADDLEKFPLDRLDRPRDHFLVGINNRDLSTFKTDLVTSEDLMKTIPEQIPVVAESGIKTREDIKRLNNAGIHIFLIGESLLQAQDVGRKLDELMGVND